LKPGLLKEDSAQICKSHIPERRSKIGSLVKTLRKTGDFLKKLQNRKENS
jgi:hypothetical protein